MTTLDQLTMRATEELQQDTKDNPRTKEELQNLINHISKKHIPAYFHTALHIAKENEHIGKNTPKKNHSSIKTPIRMILRNIEEHISKQLFAVLKDE